MEDIDAPLLAQTHPDLQTTLAHAERLETAIAQIEGSPPVNMDPGTAERWQTFALEVCAKLEGVICPVKVSDVITETLPIKVK